MEINKSLIFLAGIIALCLYVAVNQTEWNRGLRTALLMFGIPLIGFILYFAFKNSDDSIREIPP
ncbi:MAG: hypothetical protein ACFE9L_11970 [Candidatus Hodarchaeota archaeon]